MDNTSSEPTPQQYEAAVVAIEEMAELTKVLCKIQRFGLSESYDRFDHMVQELGDVLCMLEVLQDKFSIDQESLDKAIQKKYDKIKVWTRLIDKGDCCE